MANGAGNTRQWVEAPPVTPSPFGLFSVATVKDDAGPVRWLLAGMTWEPAYCGPAFETLAACEEAAALTESDGIDAVEASAFTAYHLHKCRLPGRAWTDGDARAEEALRLGEQRAAEAHLLDTMARTADVVLTDTVLHPVEGFAALEGALGSGYGGVGVIHTGPRVATLLSSYGLLERVTTGQQAKATGTRVSVGGGYGDGLVPAELDLDDNEPAAPEAGLAWMYATGQVLVRRTTGEVIRSAAGSLTANEYVALAMRPYIVGWECLTVAVQVSTGYGVPTGPVVEDGGAP